VQFCIKKKVEREFQSQAVLHGPAQ